MNGWRKVVGALALTLLFAVGLVPSATAASNYVAELTNHGVVAGHGASSLTRLGRVFYSRGNNQDSLVYHVHNQQLFAVGRMDIYSNVQDTVLTVKIVEKNETIANIDEVRIYRDSNGNGNFDPLTDQLVASSVANLAFNGVLGADSVAAFSVFNSTLSSGITVPANSHWKTAGGYPAATAAADSLSQADAHLTLFVVYKTALQVNNRSFLRAAFQAGAGGVTLSSMFADSLNDPAYVGVPYGTANGRFHDGAGAYIGSRLLGAGLLEDDTVVTVYNHSYFAGATYTVPQATPLPWKQLSYYSPSLAALGQDAIDKASQIDQNVRILRFGFQAPDSAGSWHTTGGLGSTDTLIRVFGRSDTAYAASGRGAPRGAQYDSLLRVIVTSENDADIDVKTVKLWLKGHNPVSPFVLNVGDSLEAGDTLMAQTGGVAGVSAFTAGKSTLAIGSGITVTYADTVNFPSLHTALKTVAGGVVANGNSRFNTNQKRNFLLTYDVNPVGRNHNNERLDARLSQFDCAFSTSGFTPPVDIAVDSAVVTFKALPFTVWIDTVSTNRVLRAHSTPDSTTNMHGLFVRGLIDIGDSTYNSGTSISNEIAQVKVKGASTDVDSLVVDLRAFG